MCTNADFANDESRVWSCRKHVQAKFEQKVHKWLTMQFNYFFNLV